MKHRIAFIFATISLCNISYGQINKESYEEAVNFLNCKTVELSISGDANAQLFQQKYADCNSVEFKQIEQFLDSVNLVATKALSIEIEDLKTKFNKSWNKNDAVSLLSENIFVDQNKYPKIFAFANKRKDNPELENYKANLKENLNSILVESTNEANVSTTNDSSNKQQTTEDKNPYSQTSEDEGFLGWLSDYLIIVALILGILGLLFSFRKRDVYNTILPKLLQSKRLHDFVQSQNNFNRNTQSNQSYNFEIRDLNSRIRDLESQINNLNNLVDKLSPPSTMKIQHQDYQDIKQPEPRIETLFLSTPNSDGSFNESSAVSSYREGATIYRFTKITSTNANFQIDEKETSVKLALQYPDKNIDPVCDAENAFNPKATRIYTVKEGEAELLGGKWIINTKAIIRYED